VRLRRGEPSRLFDVPSEINSFVVDTSADVSTIRENGILITQLLEACKSSNRGQRVGDRIRIESELIPLLEESNVPFSSSNQETLETILAQRGKEELIYTNDDLTRASPFFWAFAKACRGFGNDVSKQIFQITDGIPPPLKSIGSVEQTFTDYGKLISQIEVKTLVGLSSIMTTTSNFRVRDVSSGTVELNVETTKVSKSENGKILPILEKIVEKNFPSGTALELVSPGSSTVYFKVTYLDATLRVVRTQNAQREEDEKVFVFMKKEL